LEEKTLTIPVPWWFLKKRVISTGSLVFLVFLVFLFLPFFPERQAACRGGGGAGGAGGAGEEETCVESN